jgi:hypothetical protein
LLLLLHHPQQLRQLLLHLLPSSHQRQQDVLVHAPRRCYGFKLLV